MHDFDVAVELLDAESAGIQKLFENDGAPMRRYSLRGRADYGAKLRNAAMFVRDIHKGKRPLHHFKEAMTTSDFPLLFGDILDRQLLANYREVPYNWPMYAKRSTVRDFRLVRRFRIDGAESVLGLVPEQTGYPAAKLDEDVFTYRVAKYGRRIPLSWEATINDDLDAFRDIPARFGRAARRSEERFVASLFVDSNGPHASVFTVGNANIITGNPVFSMQALGDAVRFLSRAVDVDGEPISIEMFTLVIPPSLQIEAMNTVNATAIEWTTEGGTPDNSGGGIRLHTGNWMGSRFQVAVNHYIPIIDAGASGDTSWFLFANPNERPGIEMGFLSGHEEPQITMKAPDQILVSGGAGLVPEDFDHDTIQYRVRHVFGGAVIDPAMMVASDGSGS